MQSVNRLLSAFLAAALVAGCSSASSVDVKKAARTTLTVGTPADVVVLDPPMFTDVYSSTVSHQINETLLSVDPDGKTLTPNLAESFKLVDPVTYEFTLRKGVKFHNGDELTSEDVKFTLERMIDPATKSPRAWYMDPVAKIETPDKYVVRVVLKQPFGPFLDRLSAPATAIVPAKYVKEKGADFSKAPIGTGPFKFVEWKAGDHATVARFDDYWGKKATVQQIVFRAIPDSNARLLELESGGVNMIEELPPEEAARVKSDDKVSVINEPSINITYLAFNNKKAPLDNKKLRQAISYAINRDEIVQVVMNGVGQSAISPLSPLSYAFNKDVEPYKFDAAKAKQLFAESGYQPNGPIEFATYENAVSKRTAERIQAQLKEVLGLDIKIKILEWGGFLTYIRTGEHQMFSLGWNGAADPDSILFPMFHTKNFGAAGNRAFYSNPAVDKLLIDAENMTDQAQRTKLYLDAQKAIMDDAPWKTLYHQALVFGLKKDVKGFVHHPLGVGYLTFNEINIGG